MRSASPRRVGPSVTVAAATARRSAARSPVADCRTAVRAPASSTIICWPSRRPSASASACRRAASKRLGATSVLCIEAEASRITTRSDRVPSAPERTGRASARTASASRRSWSSSSQFFRSRWKGALACSSAR
ncbi:MAG TPA: hypothetical protein PKE47_01135 [Verrucomicrobiota bacterium]|nr:hypothetical protein [Verrucomicrobiota bacterium]